MSRQQGSEPKNCRGFKAFSVVDLVGCAVAESLGYAANKPPFRSETRNGTNISSSDPRGPR